MTNKLIDPAYHAEKLKDATAWAIEEIIKSPHCETLQKEGCNAKHIDLIESGDWVQVKFCPLLMYPSYAERMLNVHEMAPKDVVALTDAATCVVMQMMFAMDSINLLKDLTMSFQPKYGLAADAKVFFPKAVDLMISEEKRELLAVAFIYAAGQKFAQEVQGPMRMWIYEGEVQCPAPSEVH